MTASAPLLPRRPFRPPPAPWLTAVGAAVRRQLVIEIFGAPGYGLTLAFPRPEGLEIAPVDRRPASAERGRAMASGRFHFGPDSLTVPAPGDPWNRPSPSKAFAVELHRFAWLPHLMVAGGPGKREALRLVLSWRGLFGRWSPFAWSREVMSRRVFNLACAAHALAEIATPGERADLVDLLSRQARHLLRLPDDHASAAEDSAAVMLAAATLSGAPGEDLARRAGRRLGRALGRTVLPDGVHASRSPEAGLELLLDLLALEEALRRRGVEAPRALGPAIDRLTLALRTLTLADGRLAAFQGGEAASAERLAAARAHDDPASEAPEVLRDGGYVRLSGRLVQCMVDAAAPARGAHAATACAQPLAIEVTCGRDRLITNAGWSPREQERQGFRLTPAGSTLALGDASVQEPLTGGLAALLGPRLEGPPFRVAYRREAGDAAILVDLAHDGWAGRFGLTHERRLFLERSLDELRGEDRLSPASGMRPRVLAAPFAVRFHLAPDVHVSLARDNRSVLLRGPSGRGWWFRNDAPEVAIEGSALFDDGVRRRTQQIVLRGVARTDALTRVRWKLTPAGRGEL